MCGFLLVRVGFAHSSHHCVRVCCCACCCCCGGRIRRGTLMIGHHRQRPSIHHSRRVHKPPPTPLPQTGCFPLGCLQMGLKCRSRCFPSPSSSSAVAAPHIPSVIWTAAPAQVQLLAYTLRRRASISKHPSVQEVPPQRHKILLKTQPSSV